MPYDRLSSSCFLFFFFSFLLPTQSRTAPVAGHTVLLRCSLLHVRACAKTRMSVLRTLPLMCHALHVSSRYAT